MKTTIKLTLRKDNHDDTLINATIVERNGKQCKELIEGHFDVGNDIAIVRDLVHRLNMPIDDKVITITIEE